MLPHGVTVYAVLALLFGGVVAARSQPAPPHILVILADDLGYSDIGCYGSEIPTPNLDRLAKNGQRFTNFYNTARCWPTRSALLSGYYPQQVRRDTVPGITAGSQGKRPVWAPLIPERLATAGYRSYLSGKWHVDGNPVGKGQGFARSWVLEDHDRNFAPRQIAVNGKEVKGLGTGRKDFFTAPPLPTMPSIAWLITPKTTMERHFSTWWHLLLPIFPCRHRPETSLATGVSTIRGGMPCAPRGWPGKKTWACLSSILHLLNGILGRPIHFPRLWRRWGRAR